MWFNGWNEWGRGDVRRMEALEYEIGAWCFYGVRDYCLFIVACTLREVGWMDEGRRVGS